MSRKMSALVLILTFALGAAVGRLTTWRSFERITRFETAYDVEYALRHLPIRTVPVSEGDRGGVNGFWLTKTRLLREELAQLQVERRDESKWQGTLLFSPGQPDVPCPKIGRFYVTGDPALLAEIRSVLGQP